MVRNPEGIFLIRRIWELSQIFRLSSVGICLICEICGFGMWAWPRFPMLRKPPARWQTGQPRPCFREDLYVLTRKMSGDGKRL